MNRKNEFRLDELPPEHPLRQMPFAAPDGYFDTLPSRVQARVAHKARPAFSLNWSWQRTAASLAGVSLIALLVWQTLPQRQESLGNSALDGVSDEVIAAYLDEQGVNPYQFIDSKQIHSLMGNDTTAIEDLNVMPLDIRHHVEEQNMMENVNANS